MVQRVVYNACFGGFGLKNEAVEWVRENVDELRNEYPEDAVDELARQTLPGETYRDGSGPKQDWKESINDLYLSRDNPLLADIVNGDCGYDGRVSGRHSSLRVAEVPDGVEWTIDQYDGKETVSEKSRTFG